MYSHSNLTMFTPTMSQPVKVAKNSKFMEDLLRYDPHFRRWDNKTFEEPFQLTKLENCNEYNKVVEHFRNTSKYSFTILEVYNVQNPFLLAQFKLKALQLKYKEGKMMFHGTRKAHLVPICTSNFNWRFNRQYGYQFGVGVSFSPRADYTNNFCHFSLADNQYNFNEPIKSIFCVKMYLNNKYHGNGAVGVPPEGYDTTVSTSGKVFSKYEDSEYYPQYIIFFK